MNKFHLFFSALFFAFLFPASAVNAQAPQQFNYQAIVRDNAGNVAGGRNITLRISILNGSPAGANLYQEAFALTSNSFGLVNVAIGSGTAASGNFSTIDWSASSKYLQTEINFNDGKGFQVAGTSQLLSVPYALFALNAGGGNNSWQVSGNNINNGNTGNVGIGTTAPQTKLHVQFGSELITGWDPVNLPSSPALAPGNGTGSRHFWYLDKSAFRTGGIDDGSYGESKGYHLSNINGAHLWDRDSIGAFSFAAGYNALSSGLAASAIGGGNRAAGDFSFAGGNNSQATGTASFSFGESNFATGRNAIAMGEKNQSPGTASFAAGSQNTTFGAAAFSSGVSNQANGFCSFTTGSRNIAGGNYSFSNGSRNIIENDASGSAAFGEVNTVSGPNAFAAGQSNQVSGVGAAALGNGNNASGQYSIALGSLAEADGTSSIAIGNIVFADGDNSMALGTRMITAGHFGTVMIGDGSNPEGGATGAGDDNQFIARFAGGYYLLTMGDDGGTRTGVRLFPGDNAWSSISDSTKKSHFLKLDGEQLLQKLSGFTSLGSWTYKGQDPKSFRHYGPMAQDFHSAFGDDGVGNIGNDTLINSADMSGVLFIATHALVERTNEMNKKVSAQEGTIGQLLAANVRAREENQALSKELALMKAQLDKLSVLVAAKVSENDLATSKSQ